MEFPVTMRGFISRLLCLIAAITLMDGHIVALQSYAWASMLNDRIPEQGVSEAIIATFDGEHPCEHCLSTQKLIVAKSSSDQERGSLPQLQLSGIKLISLAHKKISLPPIVSFRLPLQVYRGTLLSDVTQPVPTPPPRLV